MSEGESRLEGHIDHSSEGRVFGWVRDLDQPSRRLEIKLQLSNGWQCQLTCDQLRKDLAEKGLGDGCYGFDVTVPHTVSGNDPLTVQAEVVGQESFQLSQSGRRFTPERPLFLVAGDIVNNCNLRCPFCVTDYANTRRTKLMTREAFERSIPLMELVPDGMFWLSCMHEPTVHPDFIPLLELVPDHLRRKISFTTNLCKKLDDAYLEALANSGVDSVRISLDSLDPELFGVLRKGGRLNVFLDNLERLSGFMDKAPQRLPVHFVTMAFKMNAVEIEALILKAASILEPARHEVRFMFYVPHAAEWGENRIMEIDEWENLKRQVSQNAEIKNVHFYDPEPEAHRKFQEKPGLAEYEHPNEVFGGLATPENYQRVDPRDIGVEIPDEPLRLRLRWDGLTMMETLPEDSFRQNILDVDADYFRELRDAGRKAKVVWERSESVQA